MEMFDVFAEGSLPSSTGGMELNSSIQKTEVILFSEISS